MSSTTSQAVRALISVALKRGPLTQNEQVFRSVICMALGMAMALVITITVAAPTLAHIAVGLWLGAVAGVVILYDAGIWFRDW